MGKLQLYRTINVGNKNSLFSPKNIKKGESQTLKSKINKYILIINFS